eukprot:TRINITY_DN60977_c0_g1_i1.p1 TRINITY_DN60977_c0_g1~~TRINITY_DN60977_c0_g1_i1.p1  ORF type:complete len:610 (-),score=87.31 TRINITY_DN60977_c0_g1_i1:26-1855(-)
MPRVLCCIWGELRGVRVTAACLGTRLLDPLGADVAVVAQRQFDDDDERVAILQDTLAPRVVTLCIYEKPEPRSFYGAENYDAASQVSGNWVNKGNTQVLINHKLVADHLESEGLFDRYDVFIFTRSDLQHMLPFPSAEQLFAVLGPTDVLTQAGHDFGGINYNLAAMRADLAKEYLSASYDVIVSRKMENNRKTYNIESFFKMFVTERGWRNLRMSVTCFITAETTRDHSTWRRIQRSETRNGVLFKYEPQMKEAYKNSEMWQADPRWLGFCPPRALLVNEIHGRATRRFALVLAADLVNVLPKGAEEAPRAVPAQGEDHTQNDDPSNVASQIFERFHLVPRRNWDAAVRRLRCGARNAINWCGRSEPPDPVLGCWLLPTSGEAAFQIARQRRRLRSLGWRVLSCDARVVEMLGNKTGLRDLAAAHGLIEYLPAVYTSAEDACFPCVLKSSISESGQTCRIVRSRDQLPSEVFDGDGCFDSRWVLQELIPGRLEYVIFFLVDRGDVVDYLNVSSEWDREIYVRPKASLVRRDLCDMREDHLDIFMRFLGMYSGFCSFTFKLRETGLLSIFEISPRVCRELAVNAPRDHARVLFEKLDRIHSTRSPSESE